MSEVPVGRVDVPTPVRRVAGSASLRPVWRNEVGGLTFEVADDGDRTFVKWAPAGSGLDLTAELVRLDWAGTRTHVPRVLAHGVVPDGEWLVTAALQGENAV